METAHWRALNKKYKEYIYIEVVILPGQQKQRKLASGRCC